MKKIILLLLLIVAVPEVYGQGIMRDRSRESLFQGFDNPRDRWDLRPRWYFNTFHRRFQRQTGSLFPIYGATMVMNWQQIELMEAQEQELSKWARRERIEYLDREIDLVYRENAEIRRELEERFFRYLFRYSELGRNFRETEDNLRMLNSEFERYMEAINIINRAHISNAERREMYLALEQELGELVAFVRGLVVVASLVTSSSISNLQNN